VIGAADPAQAYGAALAWPEAGNGRTPPRVYGAHVVQVDGDAVLYLERGGRRLLTLGAPGPERIATALAALADWVLADRSRRVLIERVDGAPVRESPLAEALAEAGFREDLKGMVLRAL
jgi:ATP-dependent Lhr-like helicase